ncbi:hypothetical protein MBLNU230_g5255t1 [Neophaeotheca triangularis]
MASTKTTAIRLLTTALRHQTRTPLSTTFRQQTPTLLHPTQHHQPLPTHSFTRYHSTPAGTTTPKVLDFQTIRTLSSSPSTDKILIDVREPHEFSAGHIPTAINVPIKSQPEALFLPEEEFEDRFGFAKPGKDVEVVFYCKSGVRSSAAAQLAVQGGWEGVSEYRGSWNDWVGNGGEVGR